MRMAENPVTTSAATRYTVTRAGSTVGTFAFDEIKAHAGNGQLRLTDQVWAEGQVLPTTVGALLAPKDDRDVTEGVIPYKNPSALASYYIGLASIIPVVGIFTGIMAVMLGIRGLMRYHAEPWRRGRLHSYAGIGLGIVTSVTWITMSAIALVLWMQGRLRWRFH
jgi:hypothetical protein